MAVQFPNYCCYFLDKSAIELIFSFQFNRQQQMSMNVQVIPVKTTGLVQTKWMDSTAAAYQDLMETNVKKVTVTDNITNP